MHFDDIKLISKPVTTFIPMELCHVLKAFLKIHNPNGVKYKTTLWRKIENNENLRKQYRPYQEQARLAFQQNGYDSDVRLFEAFTSNIDPDYLFEKLKGFYGNTIDPDVKQWHENNVQIVKDDATNTSESIKLPINHPQIEIIGDMEELQDLQKLMSEKRITQNDLVIILNAVRWSSFLN